MRIGNASIMGRIRRNFGQQDPTRSQSERIGFAKTQRSIELLAGENRINNIQEGSARTQLGSHCSEDKDLHSKLLPSNGSAAVLAIRPLNFSQRPSWSTCL